MGFGQKTETKISFGLKTTFNDQPDSTSQSKNQNGEVNAAEQSKTSNRANYLSNLKALNNSVLEWITQHVRKNPYCILTPIFKDYEKHLAELEKLKESESNGSASQQSEQQMDTGKLRLYLHNWTVV